MRRNRDRTGSVLVELAFLMLVFVPMLLGTIHFGYLFYLYNGLEKSVRDGARYAASRTYLNDNPAAFTRVVQAIVVCGTWGADNNGESTCGVNGGGIATVANLTPQMVTVTVLQPSANVRPTRVRVAISNYPYRGVLSGFLDPDGVLLLNKPSVEFPYFGRYVPSEVK